MKKTLLLVALMLVLLVGTAHAGFIADSYLHPLEADIGQRSLDYIGTNPPFDITGSDWVSATTLDIYTDWNLGLTGTYDPWYWKVQLGDLFVTTSTGVTYGVALRDHILEGDGIKAGDVYVVSITYASDWYYGLSGGTILQVETTQYGDNEIVAGYGDVVGSASLAYATNSSTNPGDYVITVQFDTSDYANVSIRIATTCANDIIQTVPEPATLLFLGLGFVGAAVYGRYRRRDNG